MKSISNIPFSGKVAFSGFMVSEYPYFKSYYGDHRTVDKKGNKYIILFFMDDKKRFKLLESDVILKTLGRSRAEKMMINDGVPSDFISGMM